jgi:hypothetical protein
VGSEWLREGWETHLRGRGGAGRGRRHGQRGNGTAGAHVGALVGPVQVGGCPRRGHHHHAGQDFLPQARRGRTLGPGGSGKRPCAHPRGQDDTTVAEFLSKFIHRERLPLFADEYQLQVTSEDQKKLAMLSPVLDGPTLIKSLGVTTLELCRRRFAVRVDLPPPPGTDGCAGRAARPRGGGGPGGARGEEGLGAQTDLRPVHGGGRGPDHPGRRLEKGPSLGPQERAQAEGNVRAWRPRGGARTHALQGRPGEHLAQRDQGRHVPGVDRHQDEQVEQGPEVRCAASPCPRLARLPPPPLADASWAWTCRRFTTRSA